MSTKVKKWSPPEWTHTGWKKEQTPAYRRRLALKGHGGDVLATARGLQRLANLTADPATKRAARADAKHFYAKYRKQKGGNRRWD